MSDTFIPVIYHTMALTVLSMYNAKTTVYIFDINFKKSLHYGSNCTFNV